MALYGPNEFPETKVGADFTLEDVLAWARTKPADEAYDFCAVNHCAVAQFGRSTGRAYLVGVGDLRRINPTLWRAAIGHPFTFGAFAERLESALA